MRQFSTLYLDNVTVLQRKNKHPVTMETNINLTSFKEYGRIKVCMPVMYILKIAIVILFRFCSVLVKINVVGLNLHL